MSREKYFQIRERNSEASSVGVVKATSATDKPYFTDAYFNFNEIENAISSHLDESVKVLNVSEYGGTGYVEITVETEAKETIVFDAEETWLYF